MPCRPECNGYGPTHNHGKGPVRDRREIEPVEEMPDDLSAMVLSMDPINPTEMFDTLSEYLDHPASVPRRLHDGFAAMDQGALLG